MPVLNKGVAFVGKNINIFYLAPECEMTKQDFIELGHTVIVVRQFIIADIDGTSFLCEGTHSFHIFSESTKPCPTEDVFILINRLTVFDCWHTMIVFTVDSISAAASSKEQAEKGSFFIVK